MQPDLPEIAEGLKSEIINWLSVRLGLNSYLEIATPTTGLQFQRIDRAIFTFTERLMYRTPNDFDDGAALTYRCEAEDWADLFLGLKQAGRSYDLVFVDPFHTYDCSLRDMENALQLLSREVCWSYTIAIPPPKILCTRISRPNTPWCGLTFAAFIDLVHRGAGADFCVVDTDYGVAIVRPRRGFWSKVHRWFPRNSASWQKTVLSRARDDWAFFDTHRTRLLNLKSLEEFTAPEGLVDSLASCRRL